MGRLPAIGVAWYRKRFTLPSEDAGKSFFIDFDGAMSYSMVWVNGQIVGGWPYGYTSYRLDITPYVQPGEENVIAVRLDNPVPSGQAWSAGSSRWYPGAGIYRDVWLVTTDPVHVAHWGTYVRTPEISKNSATVELDVTVGNDSDLEVACTVVTDFYRVGKKGNRGANPVASTRPYGLKIDPGETATVETRGTLPRPRRWGPLPTQVPNLYDAITVVTVEDTCGPSPVGRERSPSPRPRRA